jgi:hypothetical protein
MSVTLCPEGCWLAQNVITGYTPRMQTAHSILDNLRNEVA